MSSKLSVFNFPGWVGPVDSILDTAKRSLTPRGEKLRCILCFLRDTVPNRGLPPGKTIFCSSGQQQGSLYKNYFISQDRLLQETFHLQALAPESL